MKSESLHIRLSVELRQALEQVAKAENRTLSNLVETVLKRYTDEREPKPKNRRG